MNWAWLLAYVQQVLAPPLEPGDVVIMGNLAGHKGTPVRDAIEVVGLTLLFLPPDSPDLNPIERVFAKLRALLRRRPPPDSSNSFGTPSPGSSRPTHQMNAQTTSPPLDRVRTNRKMLSAVRKKSTGRVIRLDWGTRF
jgi:hypothetical protein